MSEAKQTALGIVCIVAAIVLLLSVFASCAGNQRRGVTVPGPPPLDAKLAVAIVSRVYGLDMSKIKVHFTEPNCDADSRNGSWTPGPGYLTHKGNCSRGAVAPYHPQVNVAWRDGMKLSETGFVFGMWQAYEVYHHGVPRSTYEITPEAARKLAEATTALKDAGL